MTVIAVPLPRFRALVAVLLILAVASAEEEANRIPNGDFEEGASGSTEIPGWTEVDGLTTFFVSEPDRGRVLMIDTDVNLSEADERWKEMELPREERPAPKPKGPTRPPKYDTVGGTTGAKIYSDYVRVEPGMRYLLRFDARTDAPEILLFVKGYAKYQGGFRKFYQCYKKVRSGGTEWTTYERTFNPTFRSPEVTHIRVMPYAYWPPGKAYIDNVRVTRVGPEPDGAPAPGTNLLDNGDFEGKDLAPFAAEGGANRVVRGTEGTCVRVPAGGSLVSGIAEAEEGRRYILRARIRPEGAVLTATIEGLVRMEGKWLALFTEEESAPPTSEGWIEMEVPFHPTEETPQVAGLRVRFSVAGKKGSALVDDVAIEPAAESGE